MKSHKLAVDTLTVESYSTTQANLQEPAQMMAAYPVTMGANCISCMEGCYYWVDGTV